MFIVLGSFSTYAFNEELNDDIRFFADLGDRSTGSKEARNTSDYIAEVFRQAGLQKVGFLDFDLPVPEVKEAFLEISGRRLPLYSLSPNLVVLPSTYIEARIVYAGKGRWSEIDGKDIKNKIIVCETDSSEFWLHAASLGARAIVYLGSQIEDYSSFSRLITKTPVSFPRFWIPPENAVELRKIFLEKGEIQGKIISSSVWKRERLLDVYGLMIGSDEKLRKELVILEAPYDTTGVVLGKAPGMDEATSVITLLNLARHFGRTPPKRSILFVATAGKNESFAGSRKLAWEITSSQKDRDEEISALKKALDASSSQFDAVSRILSSGKFRDDSLVFPLVVKKAKDVTDDLVSFEGNVDALGDNIPYRSGEVEEYSKRFSKGRLLTLRSIATKSSFRSLSDRELRLVRKLLKEIRNDLKRKREEIRFRLSMYESSDKLRKLLKNYEIVTALSLNLSTLSPFMEIKQQGTLFPLRDDLTRRNRISSILSLIQVIASSRPSYIPNLLISPESNGEAVSSRTLSHTATYPLSSDPLSIAGIAAATITSRDGISPFWGTPSDTTERWNPVNLFMINDFFEHLFPALVNAVNLKGAIKSGVKGLAALDGSTVFIRKGELFPDRPAPETIVNVIQGESLFRVMSYSDGSFTLRGVANKKASFHKLVVEPYGLSPDSSSIIWTANKRILRKENYRVQIPGKKGFVTLIMFPCVQTDLVDLFKPQNLSNLTKVTVLDAVTETMPSAFWYSRMDGRDTFSLSVFLERNKGFKLLLSDSLMTRDVIFLNAFDDKPEGYGFTAGRNIINAFQSALDMSRLVGSRLSHLENHGVIDQSLQELYAQGKADTERAGKELEAYNYGKFWEYFSRGWAELSLAYRLLDRTQRDVLAGVMFFIVLLFPFAYCLERFLFCFVSVYHQIAAFVVLLILSIFVIGWLHPAFALTYSPSMVIIAFLIMGLAVMVIWIIFTRFEQEITTVRRSIASRGDKGLFPSTSIGHMKPGQALAVALDIGSSNLHRRPLRTILTATTIVILTFTIMSFTSFKTVEKPSHVKIPIKAEYTGILLHNPLWFSLGDEAWRTISTTFENTGGILMPRSWINPEKSGPSVLRKGFDKEIIVDGVVGLGHRVPSSLAGVVVKGRWLSEGGNNEILIPLSIAKDLGISFESDDFPVVALQGRHFAVVGIFDEEKLQNWKDLDGRSLLPLFVERETQEELREAEIELMESGVELIDVMSRFKPSSPSKTVIISHDMCRKMGGELKALSIILDGADPIKLAEGIPFTGNLSFFAGKEGEGAFEVKLAVSFKYQGITDIVIPVIIVIAICFNTLIGNVHERKREIAVYTSIGLAPRHVGMLFVVEALSLAVLSSVFGYIIAQLIATFGKGSILFSDISLNYSSLASVVSLLLIFATVLVASIYPAMIATRMAMPDVEKGWKLPDPVGDVISLDLPFLFKIEEHHAVMKFIEDFMMEHREAGTGVFVIEDIELTPADEAELDFESDRRFVPAGRCFLLQSSVWLAPFDFGIQQRVRIYCCPAELEKEFKKDDEKEYVKIHLQIQRLTGEVASWHRANRYFVREVRKAILKWYSLTEEERAFYRLSSKEPTTMESYK